MDERDSRLDVVRTTTTLCFPAVLVLALSYMVNAHELPGEGFSAGLVVALSVLLLFAGIGYGAVTDMLSGFARMTLPSGLALILVAAAWGPLAGLPILTHVQAEFDLLGKHFILSTATAFDVGIFLVITGGTNGLFVLLGRPPEGE